MVSDDEEKGVSKEFRDVTSLATWSVSSAKVGNGVLQLLDGDTSTCWQSDGSTPHRITGTFPRRVFAKEVQIHVNHEADESYTPVRVGLHICEGLETVEVGEVLELEQPKGWISMPISSKQGVFSVQVAIYANHQNGRDTHIRGVRVLEAQPNNRRPKFSSSNFQSYMDIR